MESREQLEKRVAELEKQVAALKGGGLGSHARDPQARCRGDSETSPSTTSRWGPISSAASCGATRRASSRSGTSRRASWPSAGWRGASIALGGLAAGLVSFGGLSIGLLSAFGGLAIGGLALGGAAVGGVAVGGGAAGYYACGGARRGHARRRRDPARPRGREVLRRARPRATLPVRPRTQSAHTQRSRSMHEAGARFALRAKAG